MVACPNDHGNHGSRDGGSNTIPFGLVFCNIHINKVNECTNPSLMEAFLCGFGLWCKRSVTHSPYRLSLKIGLIEVCFAHATSTRQEFNNHNATIQRRIGFLIERLGDVFTRVPLTPVQIEMNPSQLCAKISPVDSSPMLTSAAIGSFLIKRHFTRLVQLAMPFFLANKSYRRHQ